MNSGRVLKYLIFTIKFVFLVSCTTPNHGDSTERNPAAINGEQKCKKDFDDQLNSGGFNNQLGSDIADGLFVMYATRCFSSGSCLSEKELAEKVKSGDISPTSKVAEYVKRNDAYQSRTDIAFTMSVATSIASVMAMFWYEDREPGSSFSTSGLSLAAGAFLSIDAKKSRPKLDDQALNEQFQKDRNETKRRLSLAASGLRSIFGFSYSDQKRLETAVWNDVTKAGSTKREIDIFAYAARVRIIPQTVAIQASNLMNEVRANAGNKASDRLTPSDKIILLNKIASALEADLKDDRYNQANREIIEIAFNKATASLRRYETFFKAWQLQCFNR